LSSRELASLTRRGNEVLNIHLGLHRISAVMEALGNPHTNLAVLHIAGTNGKGSVAAMSESILRQAGWRTGLYTSPHLVRLQERIRVAGRNIPFRRLKSLVMRIDRLERTLLKRKLLDRPLSYFECITACALLHFAETKVDVAVIEVGLGGLLDATNIVRSRACIITGISYDHQNILGSRLTEIAREKAGIIKLNTPVISGCRAPAARQIVQRKARSHDAPLIDIDRDCSLQILAQRRGRCIVDLTTPRRHYRHLRLALAGTHQARNAALAVTALEYMQLPMRVADVRRGLARTEWPGRLQEIRSRRRTLLEGAHNPEGAQLLRSFLLEQKETEIHLVFGAMRDKDFRKMGACLFPLARSIHLAAPANARAADPELVASSNPSQKAKMHIHKSSREALSAAWRECPPNGLVVVTGSLYLIGELLPMVHKG
jgi:dihydrofolate synthase/folylpolyglutamate synthase